MHIETGMISPVISYCVVNTNGRELLMRCLDAIDRTHPPGVEREVLVLDNASDDGSAEAVRERGGADVRLIALDRRTGKAENDSTLLREARGDYALLLNEDAELQEGAAAALLEALERDPGAAV
ncbi:MAG TPA: glycosyltransferase, partial [Thermoleophilaceae bacterium]